MFSRSISATDAAPIPTAIARFRMTGARRSRCCAERVFESRTPGMRWPFGRMMTAAATTAPQVGATPTSSTPTTRSAPSRHRRRSNRSEGTWAAIGLQGTAAGLTRESALGRRAPGGRAPAGRALRRRCLGCRTSGTALLQRGGLADAVSQEVKLCPAYLPVADDLDLFDSRAVDLERALDANAAGDLPDRDRSGDAPAAEAHDRALEDLDPLLAAFDDASGDADGVARGELGQVGADLVGDDLVEDVHRSRFPAGRSPRLRNGRR